VAADDGDAHSAPIVRGFAGRSDAFAARQSMTT
jgi:hypothetical protein